MASGSDGGEGVAFSERPGGSLNLAVVGLHSEIGERQSL